MKIVIVGGGIAGWLSALVLTKRQPFHDYYIIESENIETVGVGEGTTGLFLDLVINEYLDISIEEFFRETNATPKMGIEFNNWSKLGSSYFNPIEGSITKSDVIDSSVFLNYTENHYLSESSINGILRSKNKTSFYKKPGKLEYYDTALHLDNKKTIEFLKKKSLKSNNLTHINGTVSKINRNENGDVAELICNNKKIAGDLFIDCTGFSRIFSDPSDWISFKKNLPMNSVTTFSRKHDGDIDLVTKSNAMSSGWIWEIPTQQRYGCGYVHCNDYITNEEVESEIISLYPDATINRTFKFDSGKLKKSWKNNVISLGLSYHFLEPLQATNIHLTLVQLGILCTKYLRNTVERTQNIYNKNQYNRFVDLLIENFKDYINAHYSGNRIDTDFWKMISEKKHLTEFTEEIINLTKNRGMFGSDFLNIYGSTGSRLWIYTILGMEHVEEDRCLSILKETGTHSIAVDRHIEANKFLKNVKMLNYKELINKCHSGVEN